MWGIFRWRILPSTRRRLYGSDAKCKRTNAKWKFVRDFTLMDNYESPIISVGSLGKAVYLGRIIAVAVLSLPNHSHRFPFPYGGQA
jgi:hypothetical protein